MISSDSKQYRLDPQQRLVFRRELPEAADRLAYADRLLARLAVAS